MNLLMITGDRSLAAGRQGAFYNTLEELHKHFERIDVICPRVPTERFSMSVFGNVHVHQNVGYRMRRDIHVGLGETIPVGIRDLFIA